MEENKQKCHLDTAGAEYVRQHMPMIGLGTYQIQSAKTISEVLDAALGAGYRLIDTAQVYRNEQHIGRALRELLPKYKLKREDIFVTSKLSPANQGAAKCRQSVLDSLERLQTDYLDLLLIHWPGTTRLRQSDPKNGEMRWESWQEMQQLHREGKLRAIGVSNYNVCHLKELLERAEVQPALNQCECHPHWYQPDLIEYCRKMGIHFQAYSSFGSESDHGQLFGDPKVQAMAAKYGCSVPAFLLGWALAQGMSVLPRSSQPDHVRTNFEEASRIRVRAEDVEAVKSEEMRKYCWDPAKVQ